MEGTLITVQHGANGGLVEKAIQPVPFTAVGYGADGTTLVTLPVVLPASVDGGLFELDGDMDTIPSNLNYGTDSRYELDENLDIMPKEL